jgi:hypothetical protein
VVGVVVEVEVEVEVVVVVVVSISHIIAETHQRSKYEQNKP